MAGQRTIAGVATFIAVAAGLLALAGPATGQPGSPVPGTPYPSAPCDVEPRTIQELAALEAIATPLPIPSRSRSPSASRHGACPPMPRRSPG